MGTTLNRHGYTKLIEEDIAWLEKQERTLEREHILAILKFAVSYEYDPCSCGVSRVESRRRI